MDNPYASPSAELASQDPEGDIASRGERLGAAVLDGLISGVVFLPLSYFSGILESIMSGDQSWSTLLSFSLINLTSFVLVNGYFLVQSGQTVGKKILKLYIVDTNKRQVPIGRLLGLRYVPLYLCSLVPVVGSFLPLLDCLTIFANSKNRCAHDFIAGTLVIKKQQ